ncbi:MAG: cyclic pyranopterin monophosphate synthase MoaC, partial [Erysipelotrichaceae bacterium]|nr:cyclic pyranopterin monophosphate synthase MoaC [Erysipelotrichaceae bacterium]
MELTHFDNNGNAVMVDVSGKEPTDRTAIATGTIVMSEECFEAITSQRIQKGDVLAVAQIAGIMAAKKTSELIPLCHPLPLTKVTVEFTLTKPSVTVLATCKTTGKTGVEMEALTAVQVALLTIYDMCKA